jgi:hypothetical protein
MVIRGAEPVIVDTGAPVHRELWLDKVFSVVEPEDVRWIFLSHDDGDHTGGLLDALDRCPNATLIGNFFLVERLRLEMELPLGRIRSVDHGESFDAGDRTLHLFRPPIFDGPTTRGLYDPTTSAMWIVDSFAAMVTGVDDLHDAAAGPAELYAETFRAFNSMVSPWHQWLDPVTYRRHVDKEACRRTDTSWSARPTVGLCTSRSTDDGEESGSSPPKTRRAVTSSSCWSTIPPPVADSDAESAEPGVEALALERLLANELRVVGFAEGDLRSRLGQEVTLDQRHLLTGKLEEAVAVTIEGGFGATEQVGHDVARRHHSLSRREHPRFRQRADGIGDVRAVADRVDAIERGAQRAGVRLDEARLPRQARLGDDRRRARGGHAEHQVEPDRGVVREGDRASVGVDRGNGMLCEQSNATFVEMRCHVLAGIDPGHRQRHRLRGGDDDVDLVAYAPFAEVFVDQQDRFERRGRALERPAQDGDHDPTSFEGVEIAVDGGQRRSVVEVVRTGGVEEA